MNHLVLPNNTDENPIETDINQTDDPMLLQLMALYKKSNPNRTEQNNMNNGQIVHSLSLDVINNSGNKNSNFRKEIKSLTPNECQVRLERCPIAEKKVLALKSIAASNGKFSKSTRETDDSESDEEREIRNMCNMNNIFHKVHNNNDDDNSETAESSSNENYIYV